jgi:hypothetical protein
MPPLAIDHGHNFHSIYMSGHPLGVECRGCGRRALAFRDKTEEDPHKSGRADMTLLRTLKFVCSACGSREWAGWLFVKREEADAFVGATVGGPAF